MGIGKKKQMRIAVLPFRNLLRSGTMVVVISGFTEDLITNLSAYRDISIISYYSTITITDLSMQEKIRKLKVDYLVTGSFKECDTGIRITIQLIKASDKQLVFGTDYKITPDELMPAIDRIVQQIVAQLQLKIDYDILSRSYSKKKVELAAYENYLMGMQLLKKGTVESDEKARTCFHAALKHDPHYAAAYTGLSLSFFNEWSCRLWDRWDISKNGARKYALKAIEVDPTDPKALAILGKTYLYSEEFEKAEHCIRRSLRINPNDVDNLLQIGFSLVYLGYAEEAVQLYEKAKLLNPFFDNMYLAYGSNFYFENGRYAESLELASQVEVRNYWTDFPAYMAAACYHLQRYDEMWKHWKFFLSQFEKAVYDGKGKLSQAALEWQKKINPYRGKTNLKVFWNYIDGNSVMGSESTTPVMEQALIYGEGETMLLVFQGYNIRLKNTKGLWDLSRLLEHPDEEIHCMELMGSQQVKEEVKNPLTDEKSKIAYRHRLQELKADIEEAEELQDSNRIKALNEEYQALVDHLSEVLSLGGKTRVAGSHTEKARTAVTWRIRDSIKKILAVNEQLGKHLQNSINTGTFCSYKPEIPVKWDIRNEV